MSFSQSLLPINQQVNNLKVDSVHFLDFTKKLKELKNGERNKVRIVQIGDSHIQPGVITDAVRDKFQKDYGNGGRGLVFPYPLAKTFGPSNYAFKSNENWENWSILFRPYKIQIGLVGFGLESRNPKTELTFSLPKNQHFDRGVLMYSMNLGDSIRLGNVATVCQEITSFDTLPFLLEKPSNELQIMHQGERFNFQGLYLENDQSGIICSSIGVAGAKYNDYIENPVFIEQLKLLNPDLLIFSMGTNESFENQFDATLFEERLDTFYLRIQRTFPLATVIITGAGDCFKTKRTKKVHNKNLLTINRILEEKCTQYGFALWDFYAVMGGEGSMEKWQEAGLAEKDNIHLTFKGYQLQGELLQQAIEKAINQSH